MSGFTAINQSLEPATNFRKAKDRNGSDASLSRVTARQRAGVESCKPQGHAKNRVISNSSLYTDQGVPRVITTNDPDRGPGLPASHQTGEGSQNKAPVNAAQQSPVSAVELQQDKSSGTRSQTGNPRKRRNHVEETRAYERLQPPHKKLKQRRTVAREETTSASCSMEVSPRIPLSSDKTLGLGSASKPLRRCQPYREVKIVPTIEHQIDPGNPRHSAHPWDDPLVQDLNEDDTSHRCSQMNDSRHASDNASPPSSDDSFEPSSSSDSDHDSGGSLFRGLEQKQTEGDQDGSMLHVRNRSEEAPYLDVEIVSPAKVKRESTATDQLALRCSASWQASDRDKSLLVGNRLDFRIAEGSALASLRRMMAEIMSRLDSMAVQTRSHVVQQGQAQWEGAAVVELADISTRSPHSTPGPATRKPVPPAITSPTATDYRVPKRAASHEHFDPIERDGQPNDKRSGEPSAAPSDTTKFQSRPLADMAHRDGGTNTGPNWLNRQRWKSDNRARDDLYASSARYPAHEHGPFYGPDTPSPSQRPSVHHAATKTSRVFTTSPPHMPKIPHPPERNRLRAPASRCDDFTGVARKAYGDSFVRRQSQVDMRGQWCKPGRDRRRWSRTIPPRHLTWTRDARQNMELDRRVNARPRFQEDKLRRFGSAPAAHTRRPEVSSSLTHSSPTSARTDGLVAVGLGVKSVDSLECPATSKKDQAADINDVEALERLQFEISEHGQILEQALLEDHTISMVEVEVAEPKKKDTHDAPLESQQQRDEDQGQRRVPTRSASCEISELPDTETLLSKLEDSQNNQKVRPVFSTADAQKGGLRGTRSVETVKQSLANVPNSEIKDVSALPQSSTPKSTTSSIVGACKVSAFSRVVEKAEASSKFGDSKIGVNGTPQSTIAPGHGQRPSDQHDVRRGPATSDPKLRSFPRDGCQEDSMLTKQALSYPNTIEVHPPSNANGQRRFTRPIPSKAREIEMRPSGVSRRHCKCSFLPDYFREPASPIPNLKTWPTGRWEFFAHCQQIVECSAHPEITRTTCREILDIERRNGEDKNQQACSSRFQQQQVQSNDNPFNAPVLDVDKGFDVAPSYDQRASETSALQPEIRDYNISLLGGSHWEKPQVRGAPGIPSLPSRYQGKIKMKAPSSISHECPVIVQSCNATNSLPKPANSSSPIGAVTESSPQLPDDDQAPHSSQQFSQTPSHDSARQPLSPNTSNVTTLEAPNLKHARLKSLDSAAMSSQETLAPVIVITNSSSVEDSGTHEAHQDTEPDDNISNTRRLIHHGESPARRTKAFRRRHATEPLHSPKLMSPIKALKKASQHPTRKPLFPSSDSTLNQQQTPKAVHSNPKPARPLWEQTPPPTPPNARKKRYVPADERKQRNPELSRHVLPKDREPDDKLIEYGRLRQTYDRHLAAPYAFRYCGKLWTDYHYLADLRGGDGRLLWDEILGTRLRKK